MNAGNAVMVSGHESLRSVLGARRSNDDHFVAVLEDGPSNLRVASFAELRSLLDEDKDADDEARKVFRRLGRSVAPMIESAQLTRLGPQGDLSVVVHEGRIAGAVNAGPRNRTRRTGRPNHSERLAAEPKSAAKGTDLAAFSASTKMDAPSLAIAGEPFDVVVGLGPPTGAIDDVTLADMPETFDIEVQIGGSGFTFPQKVSKALRVHRDDPAKSSTTFTACATLDGADDEPREAVLLVAYFYRGALIGSARCTVEIVTKEKGRSADQPLAPQGSVSVDPSTVAADLTLTILQDHDKISFRFASRYPQVQLPDHEVVCQVTAEEAKHYWSRMRELAAVTLSRQIHQRITNLGLEVAKLALPKEFWDAMRSVWKICLQSDATPTLLLITEEPYIPWELAWLPTTFTVPGVAPDTLNKPLSAVWRVGRWLIPGTDAQTGENLFAATPPSALSVGAMTVVTGGPGSGVLPQADAESLDLARAFDAQPIAGLDAVVTLLAAEDKGPAGHPQVLHFAMHGSSLGVDAPDATTLVFNVTTRRGLSADDVENAPLLAQTHPVVFLNACQTAQSGELLGEYAGLAAAFVAAGATACVAPLWNVNDDAARAIANLFYDQTLTDGCQVGDVMAQVRGWTGEPAIAATITPYSYVFYGHPQLILADHL